jgi:hypothetical protein
MAHFARNFLESWLGARKWAFFVCGGGNRSLLAMPAPATRKMDVSVVIWECLFDAKAKN